MDSVLKSSSGGHSKMSPNLNARGLGLGETPLGRWVGYRGSVIVSVDHREPPPQRRTIDRGTSPRLTSAKDRLLDEEYNGRRKDWMHIHAAKSPGRLIVCPCSSPNNGEVKLVELMHTAMPLALVPLLQGLCQV